MSTVDIIATYCASYETEMSATTKKSDTNDNLSLFAGRQASITDEHSRISWNMISYYAKKTNNKNYNTITNHYNVILIR